jgi:hypothetical protein
VRAISCTSVPWSQLAPHPLAYVEWFTSGTFNQHVGTQASNGCHLDIYNAMGLTIAENSTLMSFYRLLDINKLFSCATPMLTSTTDVRSSVLIFTACLPQPQARQPLSTSAHCALWSFERPSSARSIGKGRRAGI